MCNSNSETILCIYRDEQIKKCIADHVNYVIAGERSDKYYKYNL